MVSRAGPDRTHIHIVIPKSEKARIDAQAEARNLPTSVYIRLLLAGASDKGGGTLDQLIARGEQLIAHKGAIQGRLGREWIKQWKSLRFGRREYIPDPKWVLQSPRIQGQTHGNPNDTSQWWYLYHLDMPQKTHPMGYKAKDAVEQATRYIEAQAGEAQVVAALLGTTQF